MHNGHKKILKLLLDGHGPEATAPKWCPGPWIYKDFSKIDDVRALPAPPEPKTMRQTKYLNPKACHEKKSFFSENIFSQYFSLFSTLQNPKNRVLADPGMCPYLP